MPKVTARSIRRLVLKLLLWTVIITALPVLMLRWLPPPTSAFMLAAEYRAWREQSNDFRLRHQWIPLQHISPHLTLAVIAAEDQRFPQHGGFDFQAIEKVLRRNLAGRPVRGASTLSQQTAKNLFLYAERSLTRKAMEAWFTLLLENILSKRRILEIYLNIAEFGDGIYGVEAASRAFFRKPASQLGAGESALLAAVLPNPHRFRANRPSAHLMKRRDWILRQMHQLGGTHYLRNLL